LPFAFGVISLAGCSGFNQTAGIDPLLGGPPLRPATVAVSTPPTPLPVLPLPTANATLSTAALAAGTPRLLDNNQDLRIGPPAGTVGNDGWAKQGLGNSNQESEIRRMADSTGATLRPPEPITEPPPKRDLVAVSNPGSSRDSPLTPSSPPSASPPTGGQAGGNGVSTFEQAKDELKARGALWQQLVMVGETGEWKFSCAIPNRQNPRIRRTYEAKASDPIAAIRAVIEQLDKEQ